MNRCKDSDKPLKNSLLKSGNAQLLLLRMISAIALFSLLGQANVWLDATSNALLAFGYRFLLILTPLTLALFGKRALIATVFASLLGLILLSLNIMNIFNWLAVILFSYGVAVLGFIVKNDAAKTPAGAANNKIMLNLGSLCAGLLLLYPHWMPVEFYLIMGLLLLLCLPAARRFSLSGEVTTQSMIKSNARKPGKFKWVLAGVVTGIKLFAVFSILPQEILAHRPQLPGWYGVMIILNSAIVALLQIPVMKLIERSGSRAMLLSMAIILSGLIVLAVPGLFQVHTFAGAFVWLAFLSIAECGLSYIDYCAAQDNALLIKELSVSLGAGLTVLVMRFFPVSVNTEILSVISIAALFIWLWQYKYPLKTKHEESADALSDVYEK
ncbi:hypothetical protein RABR111495_17375 [Rahnella bruchi]|uniref:hypothetical protein n=1 Tax=Rahnella bruchi TaxID=1510573 RepID=UPI000EA29FDA|nr:hypothetical protein [Rahnella bruchi]